jgi:hypothetical protein
MSGLTNWAGTQVCEALVAFGATQLAAKTCSTADGIFGLGLITCVLAALLAIGAVVFVRN